MRSSPTSTLAPQVPSLHLHSSLLPVSPGKPNRGQSHQLQHRTSLLLWAFSPDTSLAWALASHPLNSAGTWRSVVLFALPYLWTFVFFTRFGIESLRLWCRKADCPALSLSREEIQRACLSRLQRGLPYVDIKAFWTRSYSHSPQVSFDVHSDARCVPTLPPSLPPSLLLSVYI